MRNNFLKLSLFFLVLGGTVRNVAPDTAVDAYASTITTWQDFASATIDNLGNWSYLASAFGAYNNDSFKSANQDWIFLNPFPQPNEDNSSNQISYNVQTILGGVAINGYNTNWTASAPFLNPSGKNLALKSALVNFLNTAYQFNSDSSVPVVGNPLQDLLDVIFSGVAKMTKCQAPWMQQYVDAFIRVYSAALDVVVPEPQNDYQNPFLNACRNILMNDVVSVDSVSGNVTLQNDTIQVPPAGITINPSSGLSSGSSAITYYSNTQNTQYLTHFFPGSIATGLAADFPVADYVGQVIGDYSGAAPWQYASAWYYLSDASTTFGAGLDAFCAKSLALFGAYQNSSSDVKVVMYPYMKNVLLGLNQFVTAQTVNVFQQLDTLFINVLFTLNSYSLAATDANTPLLLQKLTSFHLEAHSTVFSSQDFAADVARYEWVNSSAQEGYYTIPGTQDGGWTPIPLIIQNVQAFETVFNNFYNNNIESLDDYKSAIQGIIYEFDSIIRDDEVPKTVREVLLTIKLFYQNVLLANAETMWAFMQKQGSALDSLNDSLRNVTDPLDSNAISSLSSEYKDFVEGYFNSFFVGVNNKLAEFEARLIAQLEADPTSWWYEIAEAPPLFVLVAWILGVWNYSPTPSIATLTGTQNYYIDNDFLPYYGQSTFYDGQNSYFVGNSTYVGNNAFYIGGQNSYFGQNVALNTFAASFGPDGQLLGTSQLAAPINAALYGFNPIDFIKAAKYARNAWYKDLVCLLNTPKSVANVSNKLNLFGKFVPGYGSCDCCSSRNQTFPQLFQTNQC